MSSEGEAVVSWQLGFLQMGWGGRRDKFRSRMQGNTHKGQSTLQAGRASICLASWGLGSLEAPSFFLINLSHLWDLSGYSFCDYYALSPGPGHSTLNLPFLELGAILNYVLILGTPQACVLQAIRGCVCLSHH